MAVIKIFCNTKHPLKNLMKLIMAFNTRLCNFLLPGMRENLKLADKMHTQPQRFAEPANLTELAGGRSTL
jgi:hypothetical protein